MASSGFISIIMYRAIDGYFTRMMVLFKRVCRFCSLKVKVQSTRDEACFPPNMFLLDYLTIFSGHKAIETCVY